VRAGDIFHPPFRKKRERMGHPRCGVDRWSTRPARYSKSKAVKPTSPKGGLFVLFTNPTKCSTIPASAESRKFNGASIVYWR
jgi:hypothetical protein